MCDFLHGFFTEVMGIPNLNEKVALHPVINGSDMNGDNFKSISKGKLENLE